MNNNNDDRNIELENQWIEEQEKLAFEIIEYDDFNWIFSNNDNDNDNNNIDNNDENINNNKRILRYIGGCDISFIKNDIYNAIASFIILEYPNLNIIYEKHHHIILNQPYISTFLSYREVNHYINLINEFYKEYNVNNIEIDLIFVDGCGILHPRGLGIASHLGLLLNIPTIGIAKTFLNVDGLSSRQVTIDVKNHIFNNNNNNNNEAKIENEKENENENENENNNNSNNKKKLSNKIKKKKKTGKTGYYLLKGDSNRIWGAGCILVPGIQNPIWLSIGHRISIETAIKVTKAVSIYRIPQPVREADLRGREEIRKLEIELELNKR